MSIVMSLSPDLSDLSGQKATAVVCPGSNGSAWGDAEYSVGVDESDMTGGRTVWDGNLSNGFDTSSVPIQIRASGSGTSLQAAGAGDGTMSSADAAVSGISEVDLRACAQASNAEAQWSDIVVQFYKGNTLTQSVSVGTLDATGTSDAPTEEDLAKIIPSASDNDSVIITGTVRLQCSEPNAVPSSTGLFCQALIYC
jgi:hypothetical protein